MVRVYTPLIKTFPNAGVMKDLLSKFPTWKYLVIPGSSRAWKTTPKMSNEANDVAIALAHQSADWGVFKHEGKPLQSNQLNKPDGTDFYGQAYVVYEDESEA